MRVREALGAGVVSLSCACSSSTIGHIAKADPAGGTDASAETGAALTDAHVSPTGSSDVGLPVKPRVGPDAGVCAALSVAADAGVSGRRELKFVVEREDGHEKRIIESSFFGPVQ